MQPMKLKQMALQEFDEVRKRNWAPVQLVEDAIPKWARGIPEDVLHEVYASGVQNIPSAPEYSSTLIPSGRMIGGIDIYRHAPDDPVKFNKDWYAVVEDPEDPTTLLVDGPIEIPASEHWVNEVPKPMHGVEILGRQEQRLRIEWRSGSANSE